MKPGQVIWITGLSGSGKTTIARNLREVLQQKGHSVILIDGDDFRAVVDDPYIGYDIDSRLINANRVCRLAKLVSDQAFLLSWRPYLYSTKFMIGTDKIFLITRKF